MTRPRDPRAARTPALGATTASSNQRARDLFRGLPARYDALAALLSFGQDRRWRAAVVRRIATAAPHRVLDVACGPAGITIAIARACDAQLVGADLTEAMLRQGVSNVARAGLDGRIRLVLARGEQLPFADAAFDAISFSYLLRYVDDPAATVAELSRCLAPGGTLASLEFHVPTQPVWHACWVFYTRAALPVAGLLTGGRAWWRVGRFLGPSISGHYARHPLDEHLAIWHAAGLDAVQADVMSLGGGLVMCGRKRQPGAHG